MALYGNLPQVYQRGTLTRATEVISNAIMGRQQKKQDTELRDYIGRAYAGDKSAMAWGMQNRPQMFIQLQGMLDKRQQNQLARTESMRKGAVDAFQRAGGMGSYSAGAKELVRVARTYGITEETISRMSQNFSEDRFSALKEREDDLDTAEVNQAYKELASRGVIGPEFSSKTQRHMAGITKAEALAREEVGKAGIYDLKKLNKSTRSQEGQQQENFRLKWTAAKTFSYVSDKIMAGLEREDDSGRTIGVLGSLARMGGEIGAAWNAVTAQAKESGIKDFADNISIDLADYILSDELRGYAAESAANKTNLLTLALLFASASGLGEARALSNRDVQMAIDAVGGATGDIDQLRARMQENKDNMNQRLIFEAEIRARDDPWFNDFTKGLSPAKTVIETKVPTGISPDLWNLLTPEEQKQWL